MAADFHNNERVMLERLGTMEEASVRIHHYGACAMFRWVDVREDVALLARRCTLARDCLLEQKLCMPEDKWETHQMETFLVIVCDMSELLDQLIKLEAALLS